jgi:alpha-glucosidase
MRKGFILDQSTLNTQTNPKSKIQSPKSYAWWQTGIIYQIYPRSFQDSNGDGVGDLPGITSRLDYVKSLNVDAIWISPIYPSPMADFGYDVADYTDIHPLFGTLDDFDHLLADAHKRDLKVILDFVPNHSSDRHKWFQESKSSRDNPHRDWYIWKDPAPGGGPPNNWLSMFGGSAWEWDESTGQYYLHTFLKEQPDVNWRNPQLQQAMFDSMRFWLDRGVDGFRVDVVYALIKDDQFRDEAPDPTYREGDSPYNAIQHIYSLNRPEIHEVLRRMRSVLDEYPDRMMVGETSHRSEEYARYYGKNLDECQLPFNFRLLTLPWTAEDVIKAVEEYEAILPPGAWPNWVLGNHDQPRIATRLGRAQACVAQMMLLTLRGTPTCYYGDEIGMADVDIPEEKLQDPFGLRIPGLGLGRDPERTPMQWDPSHNGGFTSGEPWLPLADDYEKVNVEVEQKDDKSMLALFLALTGLRRQTPALDRGSYLWLDAHNSNIFAYVRVYEGESMLVALNFAGAPHILDLSHAHGECTILISTHMDRTGPEALRALHLRPNEGIVARLA